jgi:hypothetical protein
MAPPGGAILRQNSKYILEDDLQPEGLVSQWLWILVSRWKKVGPYHMFELEVAKMHDKLTSSGLD